MTLNKGDEIGGLDGKALKDRDGKIMTLGDAVVNALLAEAKPSQDGAEKFKRWKLASRITDADGEFALDVDEAKMVKELVGATYTPVAVGPIWKLLERDSGKGQE